VSPGKLLESGFPEQEGFFRKHWPGFWTTAEKRMSVCVFCSRSSTEKQFANEISIRYLYRCQL